MRHLAVFSLFVTDSALLFFIPNRRKKWRKEKKKTIEIRNEKIVKVQNYSNFSELGLQEDTYLDYVKVVSFYKT